MRPVIARVLRATHSQSLPMRHASLRVLLPCCLLALGMLAGVRVPQGARAQEGETPTPAPTRTRRPTRTPRATALPSATPLPAGAVRLSLALEPPLPSAGEEVVLNVDLLGLDDAPLLDLVFDVDLPTSLADAQALPSSGETARAGSVLRWQLPALPPGGAARLQIVGVPERATDDQLACVLLVSRAATVEQCLPFRVRSAPPPSDAVDAAQAGGVPGAPPGEDLPVAPVGTGWGDVLQRPQALMGWGMLLAGLAVLGGWFGAAMGGRQEAGEPQPPGPKTKKTS